MQLKDPKPVFNMDEFLPLDGENSFEMHFSDGVLSLDIFYDADSSAHDTARRRIRFFDAKIFFKTPFPGYSFFSSPDDRNLSLLNSLVEYGYSDILEIDRKNPGADAYRHYRLFLHSTGVALHVIATSCEISSEIID